jgi:hypothetical protein
MSVGGDVDVESFVLLVDCVDVGVTARLFNEIVVAVVEVFCVAVVKFFVVAI